ncbi:hypothetical protein [Alkalihalobacterium chitinilyticum]|uniref:Glutamate--cysteine ligase n=1 Tax=Alkalihalobacterium chitinilyticum TaxID=2980103 RepID=A0ABT5VI19_9BACI|nr:hypothetical protein [Alkalihalobacterium chitinilyticum]MDE5415101.1 hypothetical protein [Alkalihalobacterium chitinilyticum]
MVEENNPSDTQKHNSSTLQFFSNLIDYAGLFPPAKLPLEQSIQNYAAYQKDKDAWMLGHFIIPAGRLDELDPYLSLFSKNNPLPVSAIGQKTVNSEQCLKQLASELKSIHSFHDKHWEVAQVQVLELPLPPVIPNRQLLDKISSLIENHQLQLFCEVTVPLNDEQWPQKMILTLNEIAIHNNKGGLRIGLKLRTGGVTANAFPTPHQVATVMHACAERDIPQKFTAGLHHPIRMYRDEVNTYMHGFLNIFTAGMLARTNAWSVDALAEVIADEDASHFTFTEEGARWQEYLVQVPDVNYLRQYALCSYGSCSFDEPRDDLKTFNIL